MKIFLQTKINRYDISCFSPKLETGNLINRTSPRKQERKHHELVAGTFISAIFIYAPSTCDWLGLKNRFLASNFGREEENLGEMFQSWWGVDVRLKPHYLFCKLQFVLIMQYLSSLFVSCLLIVFNLIHLMKFYFSILLNLFIIIYLLQITIKLILSISH